MDHVEAFIAEVEAFIQAHDMTPTVFGEKAMGDPNFVFGLRNGREPRRATMDRVRGFMDRKSPVSHGTSSTDEAAA